ncbi:MAG: T9SS type A sorting domain-containing protein, partial [Chitinophagaceae bacterium]|nr:T9SS type A sorting domain-containing protein [Chitinophagaceae bacterium]
LSAQTVTEVVTDFNGYWRSGVRPNTNVVHPNNSHNLVSFTLSGTRYSTGVNDAILTSNGLAFTAGSYKALPITALSVAPTTSTYIGLGQMYDGVAGGATPPPTNNIPFYLTDGSNGLNLGTAVYNLPTSNLIFEVGLFNIAKIGDGIPDIIVTQMGDIPTTSKDTLKFVDPSGNVVGTALAVTFAGADTLGLIDNDFYNAWQTPMGFATGFYPSNTKRAVRIFAFELSEFGLNGSNFGNIDKFVHRLSGNSDQAFVAYNTATVQILPNNNPGCFSALPSLWLKANDGTTTINNNQKVSGWQDRSANGFSPEEPISANQPQFKDGTNSFNFNSYLNFDAANRLLSPNSPWTAAENNADIFIVGRPTNTTAGNNKLIGFSRNASDFGSTNAGDFPAISYTSTGQLSLDSGSVNLVTGSGTHLNKIALHQINYTQGVAPVINVYADGTLEGTSTLARNFGRWTMQLGDISPGNDLSDFDLAEVILFPTNLTTVQRNQTETYLNIKYGLTSSHDYVAGTGSAVWSITGNPGYSNSIFGIGREDCQALHTKQSKSSNTNALITIGITGISADNVSNLNLLTNAVYSIMGDNGAALTLQTSEVPASCYQRIGREWKVRETGTVGSLLMRVPASTSSATVKLPAASNGKMYLLIDSDGDFSAGLVSIQPMTLVGTNWEVSYNFSDNTYYTFATDNGLNQDFNDLPSPWPAVSTTINGCNTNADGRITLADFNGSRIVVWAGAGITSESIAAVDPAASSDGNDDGLVIPSVVHNVQPNTFNLLLNSNVAGTVYYRMWIDWNADGNFGNDVDANGVPASYAGSATVSGAAATNVPVTVLTPYGTTFDFAVRVIISTSAIANSYATNSTFVYSIANGEVEDYYFPGTVLPVSLAAFSASTEKCNVTLNWSAPYDQGSSHFVVESSQDGREFAQVGIVKSKSSAAGANYQLRYNAGRSGPIYFRLKMVDTDSSFQYSRIISANATCFAEVIVYSPIPALDLVSIHGLSAPANVKLTDVAGRIVLERVVSANNSRLDMSGLRAGVYFVTLIRKGLIVDRRPIVKK